jgi:hypothetical protein
MVKHYCDICHKDISPKQDSKVVKGYEFTYTQLVNNYMDDMHDKPNIYLLCISCYKEVVIEAIKKIKELQGRYDS